MPTPTTPETVLAGDLNGDGVPDLVYGTLTGMLPTVNVGLHVLLADGEGGYAAGQDLPLPTGGDPHCLLVDLNQDKALDVVCGSRYSGTLSVFLGKGDGTFGSAATITLPDTSDPLLPAATGDVNGDGTPDVLVLVGNGVSLYSLVNDGAGNLTLAQTIASSVYGDRVTLADLNEDGHPDLLLQASSLNTQVFLGKGDGTFAALAPISGNAGTALADMDGDGHLDLVAGGLGILRVFHGNADGTFASSPEATADFTDGNAYDGSGFGTYVSPFAALDLNGDGVLDVLAFGNNGLTVLPGKPGLSFGTPRSVPVGEDLSFGPRAAAQQLLDMDGDGHPDFVTVGANGVYLSYGRADGSFASADVYPSGRGVTDAALADFNEDGYPDVVTAGDTQLYLSSGRADGTFSAAAPIPYPLAREADTPYRGYSQVLHGDVNGDGHEDLVVVGSGTSTASQVYVLLGHGDGTFAAPTALAGDDGSSSLFTVLDLNGDGRADIVEQSPSAVLTLFLAQADGTFAKRTVALSTSPTESQVVLVADLSGDDIPEIITVRGGIVTVLPGVGDGSFGPPVSYSLPTLQAGARQTANAAAVGDFDGDGRLDLATLLLSTGYEGVPPSEAEIVTLYGQGSSATLNADSFAAPVPGPLVTQLYTALTSVDLDGDGNDDLVGQAGSFVNSVPTLGTFLGQAGRTFGAENNFAAGTGLTATQVADLNEDGRPDLVVGNNTGNAFTVLLSEGPALPTGMLVARPNPIAVAAPFTVTATLKLKGATAELNGTVRFSVDGKLLGTAPLAGGSASIAGPTNLSPGLHPLTAVTSNLSAADGSDYLPLHLAGRVLVQAQATALTIGASPSPAAIGQQVSLTVGVANSPTAASGAPLPSGTVDLSVAGESIGTVTLAGASAASGTLSHSFSSAGSYTVVATYGGDATHTGSRGQVVVVVNAAPDFSLGLSSTAVAVSSSQNASTFVELGSLGGYAGTLSLGASNLPVGVSASFESTQASLTAGGKSQVMLTLAAGKATSAEVRHGRFGWGERVSVGVAFGCLLPFGAGRRRRRRWLLIVVGSVLGVAGLQGCTDRGMPLLVPGTYRVTVTATDAASQQSHTTALEVLVGEPGQTTIVGGPH